MNLFWSYSDKQLDDEFFEERVNRFKEKRKEFENNNLKFLTLFKRDALSKNNYKEIVFYEIDGLKKAGLKPSDLVVAYNNNFKKKTFSKLELNNLKELSELTAKLGVKIGIFDYKDVFTYDEVKKADFRIKKWANIINKHNYSPLEKLIRAYIIVSNLDYKEEDKSKSTSISRSVYGVLNSKYIVCAGFSEYFKAVVNELNETNLKVFGNNIGTEEEVYGKKDYGFHRNNICYIKDDKYKIDGYYYLDPTWDCGKNLDLTYFLIEMKEIGKIQNGMMIDCDKSLKEMMKKNKDVYRSNSKKDHYINISPAYYSSVAKDTLNFGDNEIYQSNNKTDTTEELLFDYLSERQDFKDFVTLKQTEKDLNDRRVNKTFDEIIERNYNRSNKDVAKNSIIKNKKIMWEYLSEHSPHVDIGPIQNALNTIFKDMFIDKSKDEISMKLYKTLKANFRKSLLYFDAGSKTAFRESEELFDKSL